MSVFIICYDIPDDDRRLYVAKTLENFGDRRQYSVFECHLEPSQFQRLWKRLDEKIDSREDSVLCYELCRSCTGRARTLGVGKAILDDPSYYLI